MLQFAASFLRLSSEIGQVLEFFVQRDTQDQGNADLLFSRPLSTALLYRTGEAVIIETDHILQKKGGILFAFGGNPADAVRDAGGQRV